MTTSVVGRLTRRGAVLATAVVLAGCSGGSTDTLATYDARGAGMDALLVGTVRITDTCVTVVEGALVTVPAFDGGASVEDGVLRFRGTDYPDGAAIELGGGEADDLSGVRIPAGCPTERVFLVAPG